MKLLKTLPFDLSPLLAYIAYFIYKSMYDMKLLKTLPFYLIQFSILLFFILLPHPNPHPPFL